MSAENHDRSLAALAEERNELWAQAHRVKALERDAAELRRLLAAREASLSWRLTAPLRRRRARQDRPTPNETSSANRA